MIANDTPPSYLSPEAAQFFRETVDAFALEPHHVRLLELACRAWDVGQAARAELDAHGGLVFRDDKGNVKSHPSVAHERDARLSFARLLRELDLDGCAPGDGPRPPALSRNRR